MDAKSSHSHQQQRETATKFRSSARLLSGLDGEMMGEIAAAAADIALVVEKGIVRDVALGQEELIAEGFDHLWLGKSWIDTVTPESRPKIEDLLADEPRGQKWREVNHPSQSALDVPVRYTAVKLRGSNQFIILGRDLRGVASLQQKLVEAHQELERDYVRMREAEGRFRVLFDAASEAILIVNSETLIIEDINPAAIDFLDLDLQGSDLRSSLTDIVSQHSAHQIDALVTKCLARGSVEGLDVILAQDKLASLFRLPLTGMVGIHI